MSTTIDINKTPSHIAIIMDGNGRWAKERGEKRTYGHSQGVQAVKRTVEAAVELGVEYLTLYTFSTENWNRPKHEVALLMKLFRGLISIFIGGNQKPEIVQAGPPVVSPPLYAINLLD